MKTNNWILNVAAVLLVSGAAQAAVDLDQPLALGQSDRAYRADKNADFFYLMPRALHRVGEVIVSQPENDLMQVRFKAGIPSSDFTRLQGLATAAGVAGANFRVFRPVEAQLEPGTDIPNKFKATILPLGDLDLAGPMDYSIRFKKLGKIFRKDDGEKLVEQLFSGKSKQDHIAMIYYQFSATVAGAPTLARTSVAIFGNEIKEATPPPHSALDLSSFSTLDFQRLDALPKAPVILVDAKDKCWENVQPGQFCLRDPASK